MGVQMETEIDPDPKLVNLHSGKDLDVEISSF